MTPWYACCRLAEGMRTLRLLALVSPLVANLGCGMRQIHTVNEWVDVNDMVATTELLLETVRLHTGA